MAATAVVVLNETAASILGFLNVFGSRTGFELRAAVEDIIGDFWHVTKSQIYKELKVLSQHGYVETLATGARDKQPYKITSTGRDVFRAWIRQPPTPPLMRMPIVLEVFFGADVPFDELRTHVEAMHAHHIERLRVYEQFAENAKKGTWPHEALRLGFMFQRAMIAWLETLPKKPLPPAPPATKPLGNGKSRSIEGKTKKKKTTKKPKNR